MLTRYTQKDLTWIDLVAPSPEEVRILVHEFGINPAIAQELLSVSTKPKVEKYGDELFLVFHFPMLRGTHITRTTQEVDVIIGKNFLITTRYESIAPLHAFAKAFEVEGVLGRDGHSHGGHLFAALMRNLYRALHSESDTLRTKILEIEEGLFDGREKDMVVEISQIGRAIYDFRQALTPHEEMLHSLSSPLERMFGHEFSYYLRGVVAEYDRIRNQTDNLRESMLEMRETNNSLLNAKQNEIMKNFSVLAVVFVPVSLIMGLYQMNLPDTPFAGQINFWVVLAGIVLLSLAFIIYFKRKGWL
jgi:magnesium transporter